MNKISTYILIITSTCLLVYNQILISNQVKSLEKVNKTNKDYLELKSEFIDLQNEYFTIFDEVIRLEQENQILGSYLAEKEYSEEYE